MQEIKESFINTANREIKYRKLREITYIDVLDDIEDFTKDIIYRENKDNLKEITIGMKKLKNFMLEKKFLIDKEVLLAASKTLYLLKLIRNDKNEIRKYDGEKIEEVEMPSQYKKWLKVVKRINPEAYYYIKESRSYE